jgi:hypothetical protein
MSQKNTVKTEMRVVQYPCIIAGETVDRVGFFVVDFDAAGQPLRADIPGLVGFRISEGKELHGQLFQAEKPADLVQFEEEIQAALYERPTLYTTSVVDLDNDEWSGVLFFPRLPILK